ncbi:D-TA family PLP-dependent enzyme [Pedobacter sp. L105]|uniref:D-TA family PLP-dependent enzyme n=1 Tax=Pedobacter sp. L105 TaxID=1641871 RepID=UPI00131C9C21|nr:D-TA family PLP-dependent enzyme [Pedobacter sp. L105]
MISSEKAWYLIDDVEQLDSPALVFYKDRIIKNISLLKEGISDARRLRPHVKTHKTREITLLMLEAGITKFKCATIAEAEMLGSCKAPDVLLAYQPVGPKIKRFITLIKTFPATHFACLVDNESSLKAISGAAVEAGIQVRVFLDLNVGMGRTGITPDENALLLYQQAAADNGIRLMGLHAYDGHIHDTSLFIRKVNSALVLGLIMKFQESILKKGMSKPVIVAGGTPTFPLYAPLEDIECSPGTFVLWDKGYMDSFAEQEFLTAALVVTRVISLTDETKLTVDLGHKSVASENELSKRVFFLNAPNAQMVGQSEEHLLLYMGAGHGFKIGDVLYGLPVHICPTVALYGLASIIEQHRLTEEWAIIARNRKITI